MSSERLALLLVQLLLGGLLLFWMVRAIGGTAERPKVSSSTIRWISTGAVACTLVIAVATLMGARAVAMGVLAVVAVTGLGIAYYRSQRR